MNDKRPGPCGPAERDAPLPGSWPRRGIAALRNAGPRARVETARRWDRLLDSRGPRGKRMLVLAKRSILEYFDDDCPQLAGSVAFHVLLSIFPLLIVVVSVFGLLSDDRTARSAVVDTVTTYIPLSSSAQQSLLHLMAQLQGGASALGLLGLLGLIFSAGGMMGAIRHSLTLAWDVTEHRPFIRGKALDLLLVLGAGIVLGASFGLTVGVRLAARSGLANAGPLSFLGPLTGAAGWLIGVLIPLILAFALFSFLFTFVPAAPTRFVEIWPGALVGAVLFQLLKELFAIYLSHFAHYNAVYGSLGAVAAFIFFVFLSSNALLLGA
ncbi:MAG: YihY/virulence factor BrkB family protein, partial [Sciscionella sp.]